MSSVEIRLAPVVNKRRKDITEMDAVLRGLNEIFHGQRNKPDNEKNPAYQAMRSEILPRRRALSAMQRRDRDLLKQVGG